MPKIVDHDARRVHIVEAVMSVVAREGFEHATMRKVAAEAGFAHGAIAYYFPDKRSMLTAAFQTVFEESNDRVAERTRGRRGLDAVAHLCAALLPRHSDGPTGERIVLAFWALAAEDTELQELHRRYQIGRRDQIQRHIQEAVDDGEVDAALDILAAVNQIAAFNAGWQMIGTLLPERAGTAEIRRSIAEMVGRFRLPRPPER
ncbi:TetR/AcrR family transcriptional regulator [Microbacterium sp.]|uniref:TetR/AcrR family transcriptional regulator n=1 Tax=Microbacterium sp. TaxID=51671 RepID=UPI003A8BD490